MSNYIIQWLIFRLNTDEIIIIKSIKYVIKYANIIMDYYNLNKLYYNVLI